MVMARSHFAFSTFMEREWGVCVGGGGGGAGGGKTDRQGQRETGS